LKVGIIGGGAAGFFAAITAAETAKNSEIIIIEKTTKVLSKVKISGGGRCNVTNSQPDIFEFAKNYPRGSKELVSVFSKFSNLDTISWFEKHNVKLKTEKDGRIFPISNDSQTIIDLFFQLVKKYDIKIKYSFDILKIIKTSSDKFDIIDNFQEKISLDKLIIACGGFNSEEKYSFIKNLGHTIIPPVPSLFTFNNTSVKKLSGVSKDNVELKIKDTKLKSTGSILFTHWGFSGPAILKLSAVGARILKELDYQFILEIKWTQKDVIQEIENQKEYSGLKQIQNLSIDNIPLRVWEMLINKSGIPLSKKWNEINKSETENLFQTLTKSQFKIIGKSTFKEEFVTAGGINLKEIDFRTMQSKVCPNLYFAGEVLDIDGITGGFNFQSAWSTGYIAGLNVCD